MRKPKPTRGLNLETNKSWNSCFTAISELGRRKQFDIDFSFQERKKENERKEIKGINKCSKWQLTELEIEVTVD